MIDNKVEFIMNHDNVCDCFYKDSVDNKRFIRYNKLRRQQQQLKRRRRLLFCTVATIVTVSFVSTSKQRQQYQQHKLYVDSYVLSQYNHCLPRPSTLVDHSYKRDSNQFRRRFPDSTSYQYLPIRQQKVNARLSYRERCTKRFVLTTPEAIIEQASTTKLLDDLIDESVRTSARRPLMMQFDPSSGWIWKRWKGTVFSETWDACVYRMIYACIVFILCKSFPQTKDLLSGFAILWGQLLSVTTFTLTFFVNQSYALWRKCSELSRSLQGRLHDMDMTLAAHATRMPSKNAGEPSKYTSESKQILEVVSRYVRLFNLLTYASFTRSHRPVLTPRGMRRLVERGLMTPLEREVLVNAKLPATQRHNAVLLWIVRTFIEGTDAGHFTGGAGFEQQFIEKAHVCRAAYGAIGDELQGRMPLAYAHIVQVLVDLVLALYPFMAYSAGMSGFVCVIGTGLLTIGYQGLVWFSTINIVQFRHDEILSSPTKLDYYFSQADLAKQFLDPYDNENYGKGEDPLVVDTLIAETNAGSTRWMDGLAEMPVATQKIIDGDLSDYILPRRGYTVEELQLMLEEQKVQKEKREKEELERQKKREQEEREKAWAEAMIPALIDANSTVFSTPDIESFILTNEIVEIPQALSSTTLSMGETVNVLTHSQNSNATSIQEALVPEGTAPILSFNVKPKRISSNVTTIQASDVPILEVSKPDKVIVEVVKNTTSNVVHHTKSVHIKNVTIDHIETPDVVEVNTPVAESNQNHTVAEEIVTDLNSESKDAYMPNTIEYYQQKIQEIIKASREEDLRLTRAVVMAPSANETLDDIIFDESSQNDLESNVTTTSIDDDTTELVECEYPLTVEEILEAEKQELWETQAILNARPAAESIEVLEEELDLNMLSKVVNSTDTEECRIITSETTIRQNVTDIDIAGDIFHDVIDIDATDSTDREFPVDDVLVELLETEAILNAPPGANSIEVREEEVQELFSTSNITDSNDDLSILEMDDPDIDLHDIDVVFDMPDLPIPGDNRIGEILNNTLNAVGSTITPLVSEDDSSR